jgi:aspartyl protease family protein
MFLMLRLAAIAVVGVLSAAASAEAVMSLDHAQRAQDTPVAAAPLQPTADLAQASPASGEVVKGADGHYWAEGDVNGQAVHFLVDTGATAVTLTAADAQRLGVTPASLSYDLKMTTANGDSRAARIKLTSVTVGGARLDNVDAVVVENGLQTSLLGMSYLGRLSRFEATPSALILQP